MQMNAKLLIHGHVETFFFALMRRSDNWFAFDPTVLSCMSIVVE